MDFLTNIVIDTMGKSTELFQMLYLTEPWKNALDQGEIIGVLFITKALDSVCHQTLANYKIVASVATFRHWSLYIFIVFFPATLTELKSENLALQP